MLMDYLLVLLKNKIKNNFIKMIKNNKNKDKIVLISRKFDKNFGSGAWVYADFLKEHLIKKGFNVFLIEQKDADIHSSRFKKMVFDFFNLPLKLFKYRLKGIKLFHFISENQAIWALLLNILRGKTIVTFHDITRISTKKINLDSIYFKIVYSLAKQSKFILCNSSDTKKDLINVLNVNKKKTFVTNLGTILYYQKTPKKNKIIIGSLGSLQPRKRVLRTINLAEEIKKIKKLKNKVIIEVWGKGGLKKELEKQIKNKKLSRIIKIKGFASQQKLAKVYSSFDYFYFPSKYEGFGLPIIEAARCRTIPFILSDAKIPKEVRGFCFICKDEKEIIKIIENLEKNNEGKKKLVKRLVKKSEKFTWENCFNKTIKVYESIKNR